MPLFTLRAGEAASHG